MVVDSLQNAVAVVDGSPLSRLLCSTDVEVGSLAPYFRNREIRHSNDRWQDQRNSLRKSNFRRLAQEQFLDAAK